MYILLRKCLLSVRSRSQPKAPQLLRGEEQLVDVDSNSLSPRPELALLIKLHSSPGAWGPQMTFWVALAEPGKLSGQEENNCWAEDRLLGASPAEDAGPNPLPLRGRVIKGARTETGLPAWRTYKNGCFVPFQILKLWLAANWRNRADSLKRTSFSHIASLL